MLSVSLSLRLLVLFPGDLTFLLCSTCISSFAFALDSFSSNLNSTSILFEMGSQVDRRKREVKEIESQTSQSSGESEQPVLSLRKRRLAWFRDPNLNDADILVLLDPKDYGNNPDDPAGYKTYDRVRELAQLLCEFPSDSHAEGDNLYTLKCKGWYEDQTTEQFYFIYAIPPECLVSDASTKIRNLLELYKRSRPAIGDRIKLARSLATTILQIHKNDWMHKAIRAENVVFFPKTPSAWPDLRIPRLVGFDYARREGPREYSEKILDKYANLYRHPDALQDPTTTFTKKHDYYSFGILLLEIACWKSIYEMILARAEFRGAEFREEDFRKVQKLLLSRDTASGNLNDVAFRMGEIYAKVVEVCLRGDFGADSGNELIASFQRRVIAELDRCVI